MKILTLIIISSAFTTQVFAKRWNDYLTDRCTNKSNSRYAHYYKQLGFNKCKDGTISYDQPDSNSWEGRCGHTMAANMLTTICGVKVNPVNEFGNALADLIKGTSYRTVTSGLNQVFQYRKKICPSHSQASWWYIKLGNSRNFIKSVRSYLKPVYSTKNMVKVKRFGRTYYRNPVGALIRNPEGGLHWITIIDVVNKNNICHFKVNHWDNQYTIPCTKLAQWAGSARHQFPYLVSNYLVVVFKN